MLCPSCSRLAILQASKTCIRCQLTINNNLSVLCDFCSSTEKQCSVCLKKIVTPEQRAVGRGCGCGGKK
jgi:hypothetical protein